MRARPVTARAIAGACYLAVAVLAACSSGSPPTQPSTQSSTTGAPSSPPPAPPDDTSTEVGSATSPTTAGPTPTGPWQIDTAGCPDPEEPHAPIDTTLTVAMAAPVTGGIAAAAYKPLIDGFRGALIAANLDRRLGDVQIDLQVVDDRNDPDRTEGALQEAIDNGADIVAGVVGTASNLAVRFTLNEQCIPQLLGFSGSSELGDVTDYPWTMGGLPTYEDEVAAYGTFLRTLFPDGGTIGVYASEADFGRAYDAAAQAMAADLGFDVVAEETVPVDAELPAVAQVAAVVAQRPDVVLAAPDGLDCAYFIKQLAVQRAQTSGWEPVVLLTSGCATDSIIRLAGITADGIYSSSYLLDVTAPANVDLPAVQTYLGVMTGLGAEREAPDAVAGFAAGEQLVAILDAAVHSVAGLSRASILDAARTIAFTPSLARPGVTFRTDGAVDPYPVQSLQIVRWSATTRRFADVGGLVVAPSESTEN